MSDVSAKVPFLKMSNGDRIPCIGHGTFGSDNYSHAEVASAVARAMDVGYRHFDCASVYRNEPEIGREFTHAIKNGLPREDLWITSKVWNDMHERVEESCEKSLRDLGLNYLDLYLVHWPFPNTHAPKVDVSSRDTHAVPYDHDRFMNTWLQMERMVSRGLVRHIGTSNMTIKKLSAVLQDAEIKPEANEMELHPHFQQPKLFDYVRASGMIPIGYSPIGSPSRPQRDRTPADTVDTEDPAILTAAHRLNVHPAVVCILWQIQRGSIPIPFSVKPSQYEAMLDAVVNLSLTDQEMTAISQVPHHCRLIKGQVFLWESAKDWTDLWDGEA